MAVSQATELKILVKTAGENNLDRLSRSLGNIGKNTVDTNFKFDKFSRSLLRTEQASTKSINTLRSYAASWREVASSVDIASERFKFATQQAERLEKQVAKAQSARRPTLAGAARTAGAIGAAGIFGGPEAALGAGIGGLAGGPAGAAVGGVIGAQVASFRRLLGVVAESVAEITKYRIALAGVSKDQEDYNKSIQATEKFSRQFLLPIGEATQQYTRLKASIVGAGFATAETNKVFQAIAASIIATGGKSEDLNAALNATSQVFSKGKVSAEELRQQIGERLPGAFTIFAQSLNKTPQQLDKALEDGKVTLADFLTFSEELFARYGVTSEILASAPENAGARLKVTLDAAILSYGAFFQRAGAGFQDYATQLLSFALDNEEKIKNVAATFAVAAQDIFALWSTLVENLAEVTAPFFKFIFDNFARGINALRTLADQSRRSAGGPEQRAARQVESLYPNPIERALKGKQAYQEALRVELAYEKNISKELVNREQRIKQLRDTLFKPFQPTKFGSGIGVGTVDPTADADGAGSSRAAKARKDISKELADAQIKASREQNVVEKIRLEYEAEILRINESNYLAQERRVALSKAEEKLQQRFNALFKGYGNDLMKASEEQKKLNQNIEDRAVKLGVINEKEARILEATRQLQELEPLRALISPDKIELFNQVIAKLNEIKNGAQGFGTDLAESFASGIKSMGELTQNLGASLANAFSGLGDQLAEFITTGKANFAEFTRSVLADLAKIFTRFAVFSALKAVVPGGSALGKFLGFANGGIMTANGPMDLKRYATGGIANSPQLAVFGEGSMPEAYVPLPDGRTIPVTIKNGSAGTTNVVVNVDAGGTDVQGDAGQAQALGKAVSVAVQAEILKQQRPGGLLSGTR